MTNRLLPALATAATIFVLTACVPAPGPEVVDEEIGVSPSAPLDDEGTDADEQAPATPAGPAAEAPDGCTLVTADLVQEYLGIAPGSCEPITSWADGPAGLYSSITMAIDTTASAPMYMPREVCGGGGIEGALEVPGADYGYAVDGELCIVKGSIGVKTSALLDEGVTTADDWQQLAVALLGRI